MTREQELENKLASMQEVLNTARQLATESMIVSLSVKCACVSAMLILLINNHTYFDSYAFYVMPVHSH